MCLYTMNLRNYYTSTSISATKLQISDNKGHSYTITPTAATNSLTVALLPVNNASFTFTATTTDAVYSYTKLDGVTLANCTSDNVGDVFDKDGNIYRSSSAPGAIYSKTFTNKYLYAKQFYSQNLSLNPVYPPTIKRVAMIAYVGNASDCSHGLAIALTDESGGHSWSSAGSVCSGKTAVTGGTWRLPSIKDWQYMFIGCGSNDSYNDDPHDVEYSKTELAAKLSTAEGTALSSDHWTSTESTASSLAWKVSFGSTATFNKYCSESNPLKVRACLAF